MISNKSSFNTYGIDFDYRTSYLFAAVSGKVEGFGGFKQFWHRIAEEIRKTEYEKLLIFQDIEKTVSLAEMFEVASEIPQVFPGIRIAMVDKYKEHQKVNEFCEIVATNRGARKKVFATVEAAEEWLLL